MSSQSYGMMRRELRSSQIAGQGLHPARQRVCRALVSVAGRGVGSSECYPGGVSGHPPSGGLGLGSCSSGCCKEL